MDNEGIDPSTFRMRNERSTTDLIAPKEHKRNKIITYKNNFNI